MSESMGTSAAGTRRRTVIRWAIVCLTALLSAILVSDYARVPTGPISVGDVAERTVKAPFTFSYQDVTAFEAARARAEAASPPVFLYDVAMLTEIGQRVEGAFSAAREATAPVLDEAGEVVSEPDADALREAQQALLASLGVVLPDRVVRTFEASGYAPEVVEAVVAWITAAYHDRYVIADRSQLPADTRAITIVPRVGDRDAYSLFDQERIVSPDAVSESVALAALRDKRDPAWNSAAEELALALVRPNLVFDAERTDAARLASIAAVAPDVLTIKRGETLFREGDKITEDHVKRYGALQSSRRDHGVLYEVFTAWCFLTLLLGALYLAARQTFSGPEGHRDLLAIGGTVVSMTLLTRIVVSSAPGIVALLGFDASVASVWFLVPVAGGAMLVRVLMDTRAAAMFTLAASASASLLMQLDALYVVYFLLTSLVAATSVEHMRERIAVLRAGMATGGFGALLVLVLHFVELYIGDGELSMATTIRPLWSMAFAFAGGVLSGFFVLAVVPIFESMGFVTDHRMLELASLNHPLMRQLMLRAPGTYHHSVVVGTLAEAACEAIGANSLQAKIAAYFHDIGKALEPRYFVENQQGGTNPHGQLTPEASARIIIAHVTEGARLAREHKLPKPILDNILMHHGSGLLQYFFAKAQMEAEDPEDVDEAAFRYPGPKPSTREAGVIMLADKVEAATRTIKHPTEENIRAMINRIINSVIADHQFTECPLTFQEIHTLADTFVSVLLGIYHQRIEYPHTAGISQAPGHTAPVREPGQLAGHAGTITLELEARALAGDASGLWNEDPAELTDETTDYESVRNLPQGDL